MDRSSEGINMRTDKFNTRIRQSTTTDNAPSDPRLYAPLYGILSQHLLTLSYLYAYDIVIFSTAMFSMSTIVESQI